jgi:tetratricopeptide (TPR) repeat protein
MGEGGLVPANAETTWSRRFGDCKAKTALLLAILHELGIDAEPVLVNAAAGDAVADRLPMIGSFNHVLVRAHVGGKDRWLDGTRSGDTSLDRLQIPKFGWGLPLVDKATLVRIMPLPLDSPDSEVRIAIDASAGIFTPAAVTIEQVLRGDGAVAFNNGYSQLSADQQTEFLHKAAKDYFDSIGGDSSTVAFDKSGGELRISTKGTAKLDWEDGWYAVPDTSIAYDPDFERPAGPRHDVPFATDYPNFNKRLVTIKLPSGFATHQSKLPQPVHETLTGIEYDRTINLTGDVLKVESSERTVAPEVPYKTAVAAAPRLKALNNDDVYLRVPSGYVASAQDLISRAGEKPASAQDFIDRGLMMLDASKFDQAIADFDGALGLDPKNVWALADRGIARIWKRNFDEAAKDLAAVEAVDPRNSVLLRAKGLRAEIQGDLKTAVEFYSKSLEQEPGNSFALARRGEAQQMQGKMAEALKDYDALVARNPKSENALAIRATALASLGRFAAAEGDIRSALAINPNSAPAYDARGKIASVQGDMAGAVEAYTQELRIAPDALSALSGRTAAYRNLRHYDLALADADTGLKAKPGWPEMRVARANVLLLQGKRQDVEKEAELLESENPNSEFAFVAAARIYAALGQHEKAMGTFSHALKIKPAAYIYVNRAQSRPYTDFTGRIADLDSALQLEPDNADALSTKANVLATMGKYAEAIALYDRVPKLPGNAISVAAMRAVLLQKSGDTTAAQKAFADARLAATTSGDLNELCWNKAIGDVMLESAVTDCRTALERSPDNPAYLDSLGMALLKLGKLDEALNAYDRAIEKNSGPTSYMGRAFVYLRKGDLTHAEADAQVARKRLAGIDDQFAQYGLKFEVKAAASTSAK